jgi:hypothetical protein
MSAPSREGALRDQARWLRGLCDLAQAWVGLQAHPYPSAQTGAYVDLVFAFGLARLGAEDDSAGFLARAEQVLGHLDEAHQWLLQAFSYRIRQARGGASGGPLPTSLREAARPLNDRARIYDTLAGA